MAPYAPAIAVDMDGTLCENAWPEIGQPRRRIIAALIGAQRVGVRLVLWTCRTDRLLIEALEWTAAQGLFFDHINETPEDRVLHYGSDPRKASVDLYLDDRAAGWSPSVALRAIARLARQARRDRHAPAAAPSR